jgi:hypothetical protein
MTSRFRLALTLAALGVVGTPALSAPSPQAVANQTVYRQWAKAPNRAQCAPLGVTAAIADGGKPRAAYFGGGWGVAFDRPGLRSAFGVAGTGVNDAGQWSHAERTRRLSLQWPLVKQLQFGRLPAVAGYGLLGGKPFPADNLEGANESTLAYVYVDGQNCLYNVWSNLGRAHLETLLNSLFVMPKTAPQRRR